MELVDLIPRRLGEAMAAGELDAGPLSLMDYLRLEIRADAPALRDRLPDRRAERARLLRPAALGAARGPGRHHRRRPRRRWSCCGCCWPSATRSSPRPGSAAEEPCDAAAPDRRPGDPARSPRGPPARHVTDLGLEWRDWTGLPFVFARWAVAARVPAPERRAFEQRARRRARPRDGGPARDRRAPGATWAGAAAEVESYLRNFAFRLGPDEEKGAAEFLRLRAPARSRCRAEPHPGEGGGGRSGSTAPTGSGSSPRRRCSTWAAWPRRRASAASRSGG